MSPRAQKLLPYEFECKHTEHLTVWAAIRQALTRIEIEHQQPPPPEGEEEGQMPLHPHKTSPGPGYPIPAVLLKRRRHKPLAVVPFGNHLNPISLAVCSPFLLVA